MISYTTLTDAADALAAELAKRDQPFTYLPVHEAGFTRTTVR